VLSWPFTLDPALVPDDADLVIIGNPTNPTSVLHPAATLRALCRPGRTLVVDEAFMDAVPGEGESLVRDAQLPGLVVVRSLTKTWGLAGLRVGYLLAEASTVVALGAAQPKWAVSGPALAAAALCSTSAAHVEADAWAPGMAVERARLERELNALPDIAVVPGAAGPFLLLRAARHELWKPLRGKGFAVRRGDSFPGLGTDYIRVAVRDRDTSLAFVRALKELQ
jgi:histidinol-phosphate aminotransferase